MKQIISGRAARLSLTAVLFVTVLALAQSTELGRIHENCQSLGKNWTKFNCPFNPDQRRCLGLEIAYEASPECATAITLRRGLQVFVPQVPSYGALDHYLGGTVSRFGTIVDVSEYRGDLEFCCFECNENLTAPDRGISDECCTKLCGDAFAGGTQCPDHPPSSSASCPL